MGVDGSNDQDSLDMTSDCPLTPRQQFRNILFFAANVGLIYLAAPVVYVGITQAALCDELKADKTVSNLPSTVYFFTTPLPIFVAWYFPYVRLLKPVLVVSFLLAAASSAAVTATLLFPTPQVLVPPLQDLASFLRVQFPPNWVIPAINLQAAVLGVTLGVVNTFQWEVLGRGASVSRRGQALTLAFGFGPILAAVGSFGSQFLLRGIDFGGSLGKLSLDLSYPTNFLILFGASVPIMALAALLSMKFVIPAPRVEITRQPFWSGIFGGLGEYLSYRLILTAAVAFVLVAAGYNVLTNLSLFTELATGKPASHYAGWQNTFRFGFKAVVGLFLGWLLSKTNPKAGMLVTGAFCAASVLWALTVHGMWFLFCFALMGAGELMGLYYPNYIFYCSAKSRMRRNMAFTNMLNVFTAGAPVLFGKIADTFGAPGGPSAAAASTLGYLGSVGGQGPFLAVGGSLARLMEDKVGFEYSFYTAVGLIVAGLFVAMFGLPARPSPREIDQDEADRPWRSET